MRSKVKPEKPSAVTGRLGVRFSPGGLNKMAAKNKDGAGTKSIEGIKINLEADGFSAGYGFGSEGYDTDRLDSRGYDSILPYLTANAIGCGNYGSASFVKNRLNGYCSCGEKEPPSFLELVNTADDEFKRYRKRIYGLKRKADRTSYRLN